MKQIQEIVGSLVRERGVEERRRQPKENESGGVIGTIDPG